MTLHQMVQYDGRGFLHGGVEKSDGKGETADLQQRSRKSVYLDGLHTAIVGSGDSDQHGRKRPLFRQYLHRTLVAYPQAHHQRLHQSLAYRPPAEVYLVWARSLRDAPKAAPLDCDSPRAFLIFVRKETSFLFFIP